MPALTALHAPIALHVLEAVMVAEVAQSQVLKEQSPVLKEQGPKLVTSGQEAETLKTLAHSIKAAPPTVLPPSLLVLLGHAAVRLEHAAALLAQVRGPLRLLVHLQQTPTNMGRHIPTLDFKKSMVPAMEPETTTMQETVVISVKALTAMNTVHILQNTAA
jgi:hypothetical protein